MTDTATAADPSAPLFDVVVRTPSGAKLEDIERKAIEAGIAPASVANLIKVLKSRPDAKIGSNVSRERADRAREQFTAAGLNVEVMPVMVLSAVTTGAMDGLTVCPACSARVRLTADRQCTQCGVYVDKVTDEFLLRRKIMEQERGKIDSKAARERQDAEAGIRKALEASIRAQVLADLEKEYGLNRAGAWKGKAVRGGALVLLVLAAFAGGTGLSPGGFSMDRLATLGGLFGKGKGQDGAPRNVDAMLDTVGPRAGTAAPGAAGAAAGATGDPDIDDPLIQAAGGKRVGAKGLTIEQAVAAAQTLASGMPGSGGAAAGTAAAGTVADAPVSRSAKLRLTIDFANELGALGQSARGRAMVQAARAAPETAATPGLASALRVAEIEVQAWALHGQTDARARQGIDALVAAAAAIADPGERAVALSRVAVVLSRHLQLPATASQAFLTLAADTIKTLPDAAQRPDVVGEWTAALAETLLVDVKARARDGRWSQAQAAGRQLDVLAGQVADAKAQARILAIRSQAQAVLGQQAAAVQSLDQALALAAGQATLVDQTQWLRLVARDSRGAADAPIQAAVATLRGRLEAAPPVERAQGLSELSLLHTDAGLKAKADPLRLLAQQNKGLTPAESADITSNLIVRSAFAQARLLHEAGSYAEAEAVIQRIGGYLL